MKKISTSKWLHSFSNFIKIQWALGLIFTSISALFFILFSYYISLCFSEYLIDKPFNLNYLLIASVSWFLKYLFSSLASFQNINAGEIVVTKMKENLIIPLFKNTKISPQNSADYYSRLTEETRAYFTSFIPSALASVVIGFICLIVFFSQDIFIGIILFFALFLIPLQMIAVGYGAEHIHEKHISLFLQYANTFYNRTQAISGIKNLGNFKQQYDFIKQKGEDLTAATMKVMRVAMLSSALMELFITLSIAIVAIYLGLSLLGYTPNTTLGRGYSYQKALFILLITPYYYVYFRKFVAAYHDRSRAIAAGDLLMNIEDEFSENDEFKSDINLEFDGFFINNVSFYYESEQHYALNQISFTFPKKGIVLMKGISGSGKSTLLKILSGYLSAQNGEILNNNSHKISSNQLKNWSVYMNQHPYIFDGTIRYNIELDEKLNDEEISSIINKTTLEKIVSQNEKGLETILHNNGISLSGGQRQLLSFARLLAHKKPLIILDEPTTSLDENTSIKIVETIKDLSQNHLIIVASHETIFEEITNEILTLNWGQHEQN